ncbi:MAG: NAD(P)H-dependent oxidoreductase [Verrucomicrobiota bacterium]
MKPLVIVAHPNLTESRFNQTLYKAVVEHPDITTRVLYEAYPDWKIDVAHEQALLEAHDRIILQFPLYWYSTPPMLKLWEDEVLTYGWAYGSKGKALHGKELMLALSIGGGLEAYRAGDIVKYTLSELLRPLQASAEFCGMTYLPIFPVAGTLSDEALAARAEEYVKTILEPWDSSFDI